jgi:hypothetical protein
MVRAMLAANDVYPQGIPQNIWITNGSPLLTAERKGGDLSLRHGIPGKGSSLIVWDAP